MALRKAGVEGPDAIAVGDTPYDVQAAAKCKVQTIALRSGGFADDQLNATGPLAIAMDVNALFEDQDVLRGEDGHRHGCL